VTENPLDYESASRPAKRAREWWYPVSGGLCIIGGGMVAIAGSIIVATNEKDIVAIGITVLLGALVLIIVGLVRWT
jgi:hypothetical protein